MKMKSKAGKSELDHLKTNQLYKLKFKVFQIIPI